MMVISCLARGGALSRLPKLCAIAEEKKCHLSYVRVKYEDLTPSSYLGRSIHSNQYCRDIQYPKLAFILAGNWANNYRRADSGKVPTPIGMILDGQVDRLMLGGV